MIISNMYLFENCPLRRGLDFLGRNFNENGVAQNFAEALRKQVDGAGITWHSIPIPEKDEQFDVSRVIPEDNEFDLCVPSRFSNLAGREFTINIDAARRINYIVVKEANTNYHVGFFVSLKGIDHTRNNPYVQAQTIEFCDVYIYRFERDVVNTALQNGAIFGINGAAVLAAKTNAPDVVQSGALTGATPICAPVPNAGEASSKVPVAEVKDVRVMGLFTSSPGDGYGDTGEVFWLQSTSIPYNGDSGTEDETQKTAFRKLYLNYEYLSTCTGIIAVDNSQAAWRVQLQKLYIVPENWSLPLEYTGAVPVRAYFDNGAAAETLDFNYFYKWTPDAGCYYGETALQAPDGWDTPQARRLYTDVSLGTFAKRVAINANEIDAGARICYGLAGEDVSIILKTSKSTTDLTEAFLAPVLSNEAQQLLAAQKTSNAVSGVAAAVSVATGIVTGNPLAAIGGVLSGAKLIGDLSTQKTTPYTIEADSKAFRTLYGLDGWKTGTRGGIYWERVPTLNAEIIGHYQAAFGERFTYSPIIDLKDVFANGTGAASCLYFKLSGGVLDGNVSAEDGAAVLEAFQDGARVWSDWAKMKAGNYGDA